MNGDANHADGDDMTREQLGQLNSKAATEVRELHDALHAGGYEVTVAEAKFVWVAGLIAAGKLVDVDVAPLEATLKNLAKDLPVSVEGERNRFHGNAAR